MKKISVIIPMYNSEEVIEEALDSVYNQDFNQEVEVIIIDDCSKDNSVEIVEKYVDKNKITNFKLLKNKVNSRQGYSRNRGIEVSTGEYIVFLDSDDKLYNNKVLQKLQNIIEEKYPDMIYGNWEAIGEKQYSVNLDESKYNKEYMLTEYKWANVWSICWKTSFIKENNIKFLEGVLYEDLYFYFLGTYLAKSYEIANFETHYYIVRKESSMSTKNFNQVIDTIKIIEKMMGLRDIMKKEDWYLLDKRVEQQKSRIIPRLERVIEKVKNNR